MESSQKYWFLAKAYGWGWGVPRAWQGWVVLAGYVMGMIALTIFVDPESRMGEFLTGVAALTVALLAICFAKGEPPRWRWGRK